MFDGYHDLILSNVPTYHIEYLEEFVVHIKYPFSGKDSWVWYYPCFFNNRKVNLNTEYTEHVTKGIWGVHYI